MLQDKYKYDLTTPLTGDAGTRCYYRVALQDQNKTAILCAYKKSNEVAFHHFLEVQTLLKEHDVNTPNIIEHQDPHMLLEDLGSKELEGVYSQTQSLNWHFLALEELCKMQKIRTDFSFKKEERTFTQEKFSWELGFAYTHLTQLFKLQFPKQDLLKECSTLCGVLLKQKQVFTHRDYHSRNLILYKEKLYVIDFQDARQGPYTYDVVSLVEDSYVQLNKTDKLQLQKKHCALSGQDFNDEFQKDYLDQSVQRTLKACGSFASLKNLKGSDRYLPYLKPALNNLTSMSQNAWPHIHRFAQECLKCL